MPEAARNYPDQIEIAPLSRSVQAELRVPGSKSITNRALILAALRRGQAGCELRGALRSEDTEVMVEALRKLGIAVRAAWDQSVIQVPPRSPGEPLVPANAADLYLANSGTSIRFLTALAGLGTGRYCLDGNARMRERPIGDLLDALRQCGVSADSEFGNGCPPVIVNGRGPDSWSGRCTVRGNVSSQFLSALLMAAPFGSADHVIEVEGPLVSEPYADMTVRMMNAFGVPVQREGNLFRCQKGPPHQTAPSSYGIEPDASAASYFLAAAAVIGGRVTVLELQRDGLQGDIRFADFLEQMGCRIEWCEAGVTIHGRGLHGINVDMNAISDTVMSLAVVALFAAGPTSIRNVAHVRHKETDRLAALATELRKLGAGVEEFADGLTIVPGPLHGAALDTYNDHRMAMSLALVGLRVPGVVIRNPGCVAKTYPGFWEDFARL